MLVLRNYLGWNIDLSNTNVGRGMRQSLVVIVKNVEI